MISSHPVAATNNPAQQQDVWPLLRKFIRASAMSAFSKKKTQLPLQVFQNYFLSQVSYHPFVSEFKTLSWNDMVEILTDHHLNDNNKSTPLFAIDSSTVQLLVKLKKLKQPAQVYLDDLTMLRNTSTSDIGAALRKISSKLPKSLSKANQELHKKKKKVLERKLKKQQRKLNVIASAATTATTTTLINNNLNSKVNINTEIFDNNSNNSIIEPTTIMAGSIIGVQQSTTPILFTNDTDTNINIIDSNPNNNIIDISSNNISYNTEIINQIDSFLELFPKNVQEYISNISGDVNRIENLIEIAMDKGRPYELFYYHTKESFSDVKYIVQQEEIDYIVDELSFGTDNRAGIDGSLHRISAIYNRNSQVIGLTLRVGRAVMGRSLIFSDLVEQGKSILLLGKPGSGKTTFIRDFAKNMALGKRVVVVDTSCEIGGFGDIPHVAIGKARRMQVSDIRRQQEVMIQAVQNHTPEVIVIDEIGTREEVSTARTIAQRGVILCGSAHGDMKSILKNPILCELLGGVESVIMSDRNATKDGEKMRLQVKADPIFDVVIQLPNDTACNEWKIYTNLRQTVQNILAKRPFQIEIRKLEHDKLICSQVLIDC